MVTLQWCVQDLLARIILVTNFMLVIQCIFVQSLYQPTNAPSWGSRREGDHWGDLGIDVWIILGWISRRWDVGIWTGLGWPRIETGGGRL